jgi:hypothetical protein
MQIPAFGWPLHWVVAAKPAAHVSAPAAAWQSAVVPQGAVHMPQMQLAPPQSAELEHTMSQLVFLFAVSLEQPRGSASASANTAKGAAHFMARLPPA